MLIFHTGDVHLDSPFSGLCEKEAEERRRDVRNTFSQMMKLAADKKVDMVIISGDLFDKNFVTRETIGILKRDFANLSCPVVIAPGNHDSAGEGSVWSKKLFGDNVYVFSSPRITKFSFDALGCDVYGFAFTSPNMTECPIIGERAENSARINLLCGHCDTLSSIGTNCPVSVAQIKAFGADYAFLGHIHNPDGENEKLGERASYCGCPEGRDFGECGEKGAYFVKVSKNSTGKIFVPFSKKKYEKITIGIDFAADFTDISEKIKAAALNVKMPDRTLLRISLTGAVDPSLIIDTKALSESIEGFFHIETEDNTTPTWNSALLDADKGIKGEVFRLLKDEMESPDSAVSKKAAKALKYAVAALNGETIGGF